MPSYRCRRCGTGYHSAARLADVAGGNRCDGCGGRVVEVGRRTVGDRQVGNVLYPGAFRDVQAAPIGPPLAGGER